METIRWGYRCDWFECDVAAETADGDRYPPPPPPGWLHFDGAVRIRNGRQINDLCPRHARATLGDLAAIDAAEWEASLTPPCPVPGCKGRHNEAYHAMLP
jgi:hypothetical protein